MNIKSMSFTDLMEAYCQTNRCWAVYIAVDQFWDSAQGDYVFEFDILVNRIKETFTNEPDQLAIMSGIVAGDVIFLNETGAFALYNIMEATEFYSKFYACIAGPKGLITENT